MKKRLVTFALFVTPRGDFVNARLKLDDELNNIIMLTQTYVKRLRKLRSNVFANQFVSIGMNARRLLSRTDLLIPVYRRRVESLKQDFEKVISEVNDRYPGLIPDSPARPTKKEHDRTETVKVSITLPAGEWAVIDLLISNGFAKSRSAYFRKLHTDQRR